MKYLNLEADFDQKDNKMAENWLKILSNIFNYLGLLRIEKKKTENVDFFCPAALFCSGRLQSETTY